MKAERFLNYWIDSSNWLTVTFTVTTTNKSISLDTLGRVLEH